ncbi:protein Hydra magnipapillata [Nesidiocoris tenuis]|uniref:Protein Hydra magnipapillata n=1 Tax=Nesidiocoris tenuis TaxID=355587 RepID=A0ABN7BBR0_9HEMI|nr:protein Hydra magnipapillata [Nesidiocoris tenuis]
MEMEQAFALIVALKLAKKRKFRKRECWVRKWVDRRIEFGACSTLVSELKLEDAQQFRNFIRMSAVQFESLLDLVKHQIVKKDTKFRAAIPPHFLVLPFPTFTMPTSHIENAKTQTQHGENRKRDTQKSQRLQKSSGTDGRLETESREQEIAFPLVTAGLSETCSDLSPILLSEPFPLATRVS